MEAEHLHQLAADRELARQHHQQATDNLKQAVIQAVVDGHPKTWIAQHAGITRMQLDRWIKES